MKKELPIRKIRPKVYKKIIEVRVPIRFYWDEKGFDGIELGPFDKKLSRHCRRLLYEVLDTVPEFMHKDADIPKPFEGAFKNE